MTCLKPEITAGADGSGSMSLSHFSGPGPSCSPQKQLESGPTQPVTWSSELWDHAALEKGDPQTASPRPRDSQQQASGGLLRSWEKARH